MASEQIYRAEAASDLREDFFKIALCLCAYFPLTSSIASLFLLAFSNSSNIANAEDITNAFIGSPIYSLYLLAISLVPISVCILLYLLLTKRKLSLLSLKPTISKKGFALFFALGLCSIPLSSAASSLWGKLLSYFEIAPSETPAPDGAFATIIFIVAHALLAPVLEELLFRSLILERLRRYGDIFAVIVSALLFMLLHASFSSMAYSFVSGIIFGLLAVYTGSVLCPMLLHFINNAISVVMIFLSSALSEQITDLVYVYLLVIFAVISLISFIAIKKKSGFSLTFSGEMVKAGRKASIVFSSLPMLIFMIMAISLAISAVWGG
ncbi:MAG: CPBP family intramembrane metalloprotease [Oscillospiraceae bacterium]|nr:CPBP family intramembrane metalloprotease [Oscillospiraceae bacterium]